MHLTPFMLQAVPGLDFSSFRGESTNGGQNPIGWFVLLGAAVFFAALSGVMFLNRRMAHRRALEKEEEKKLVLVLAEVELENDDRADLEALAGKGGLALEAKMVTSRQDFETTAQQFRAAKPDDPLVKRIPHLRQRLGYGLDNPRTPFTHTRMLMPGAKMRCVIPLPQRQVSYVTTVVTVDEDEIYIMPPTQKGKPVLMAKFPALGFRLSRQNDAEYSFTCPVISQNHDGIGAVQLGHSDDITRMLYRHAPRFVFTESGKFFVIRRQHAVRYGMAQHRPEESQYAFQGQFQDLSMGGLCVLSVPGQQVPDSGDVVVFRLTQAGIKESLVAQLLSTRPEAEGVVRLHLKFTGLREVNRLKLAKFLEGLVQLPPSQRGDAT